MKKVIIVGAGTGGITVAARLINELSGEVEVTLIDPAASHFYQPLWTLVGAGITTHEKTEKSMKSVIPEGVKWLQEKVATFNPEQNLITLDNNTALSYDILIVAAGMQLDFNKIKGAVEALEYDNVCSNYKTFGSTKTWKVMQNTTEGNAIFTQPPMPIKCGGGPQKAVYLADDYFRQSGKRSNINLIFANHGPRIFGIEKYKAALEKVVKRKEIDAKYEHNLVEIRPQANIAVFERPHAEPVEIKYSMLHFVPPMSSPDFIKKSPIVDAQGYVEVDKHTLQHVKYSNIFSLGDCSSLPTARTGAAIRKQAPVLVANLKSYLKDQPLTHKYNGYTSCPLVTGQGRVILAEFDYDGNPVETFPFDQSKERWSMWILKSKVLPILYWKGMLKGRA